MDGAELLMRGTLARCPDCGGLLVPVDGADDEYCCTACDAAVLLDLVPPVEAAAARRAG